jgi:RimJ/RimL family protein N-acetyltransferase
MFDPLKTERLIIRNWRDGDRDLFFEINSDDEVMAFFPFRRDRAQADELMDRLASGIEHNGFGFAALELADTGACIGFCGLHRCSGISSMAEGTIEIGWRLAVRYQGNGYVTEAARRWLKYGFEKLHLDEIVSFAVAGNKPSIAVMQRLAMNPRPERDFDLQDIPDTHAHLRRHLVYTISRQDWKQAGA